MTGTLLLKWGRGSRQHFWMIDAPFTLSKVARRKISAADIARISNRSWQARTHWDSHERRWGETRRGKVKPSLKISQKAADSPYKTTPADIWEELQSDNGESCHRLSGPLARRPIVSGRSGQGECSPPSEGKPPIRNPNSPQVNAEIIQHALAASSLQA